MSEVELTSFIAQNIIQSTPNLPTKCSICSEICTTSETLNRHMSMFHLQNTDRDHSDHFKNAFKCSTCSFTFKTQDSLISHQKIHSEHQRPYQCSECSKSYLNKRGLDIHRRVHNDSKQYACHICPYKSTQTSNLKTHMLKHDVAQFKCDRCNKVFKHKPTLVKHVNDEHLGKKVMFPCPFCNKEYMSRRCLEPHIQRHAGDSVRKDCPICHKINCRFQNHITIQKGKLYACNVCNKNFKKAPYLQLHMRVHTGEKPYECEFCSKRFSQHAHYMAHLRTHTSEKAHQCNICKQWLSSLDYLKVHMKKHEGTLELKYSCTVCSKKFLSSHHVRMHAVIHLPPAERQRFECKECGIKLATKRSLTAHMKKHTGSRIKCAFCERDFYREDMYNSHLRTHTDEKEFVCTFCGEE